MNIVRDDPADNRDLECAAEGAADYLVSGDRDLLDVHEHGGALIVTLKTFLDVLRASPRRGGPAPRQG